MKLPQALSVVKIFNTPSPFLTLLLTDVLFFTPSLPPEKRGKLGFLGQWRIWGRSGASAWCGTGHWARQVWFDRTCARFWGDVPEPLPTPRIVGFPFSLLCYLSAKNKPKKKPPNPPVLLLLGSPHPLSLMSFVERSRDCKGNSSHSHIKKRKVGAV